MLKDRLNITKTLGHIMYSDNSFLSLYALQRVATHKLRKKDCVYIFDETGAGKTISIGNCIVDLLYEKK